MSLNVQHLTKTFQGVPAVQDLWLQVGAGEIVSLLGPSGCGKSTTLQLISGVLQPDRGSIELAGRCLDRVLPEQREIALVLQKGLLFPHLTVGENVAFGLKMRGENRTVREAKATAMLKRVQLAGFGDRKPSALSGGQSQRVALARALVIQPKLLLLDEPLSALDASLREEMQNLILTLQAETNVTLLIVTHDQAEAVVLSDRIALMFHGRLRQIATPEVLYYQPGDEATARFLGGVNFFAAGAAGDVPGVWSAPATAKVTIRPEQIQVFAAPPVWDQAASNHVIPAIVRQSRFTGTQRRLTLDTQTGMLQAWLPSTQTFEVGDRVWAYLPPNALWCLPAEPSDKALPWAV